MKFGDFIKARRNKLGWTQPEAATRIEIEQSYLSKLENGHSIPSHDVFARLCRVYEIEIPQLYQQLDSAGLESLMAIDQIRTIAAVKHSSKHSEAARYRLLGVIAFGLGGMLLGIAQVAPFEESHYIYQTGEFGSSATEQRSQPEYRGPVFVENTAGEEKTWQLIGSEVVAQNAWARWLMVPGLGLLFGGAASFANGWRRRQ